MNNIPMDKIDIVSRFLALILSLSEDERKQLIAEWESGDTALNDGATLPE